ncbi:uncharacterized protein AMSG_03131 [Thecamonas trahens ATCC 50062]|uniref:Uncharacterized protein n=1 Tax=Thecamonas trahens ATCC 50062 TaxID=461836 RepID=A0A0L0D312_THETB|nr:hypothetical protein AMSG_03131 [Thecamonas trahens ATCC 50062]KNC46694.1 hypothetical protein AMSG_03131 [Thecamonas trahens ATCC 50062]|eukprot:XP_013760462.1 hypothetical protein AMSG_03131 [Thecamonas trahens ATCC 50062]
MQRFTQLKTQYASRLEALADVVERTCVAVASDGVADAMRGDAESARHIADYVVQSVRSALVSEKEMYIQSLMHELAELRAEHTASAADLHEKAAAAAAATAQLEALSAEHGQMHETLRHVLSALKATGARALGASASFASGLDLGLNPTQVQALELQSLVSATLASVGSPLEDAAGRSSKPMPAESPVSVAQTAAMGARIAALEAELNETRGAHAALQTKYTALGDKIAQLIRLEEEEEESNSALRAQNARLQARLDEARLDGAQSSRMLTDRIALLDRRIADLESTNSHLQVQLDAAVAESHTLLLEQLNSVKSSLSATAPETQQLSAAQREQQAQLVALSQTLSALSTTQFISRADHQARLESKLSSLEAKCIEETTALVTQVQDDARCALEAATAAADARISELTAAVDAAHAAAEAANASRADAAEQLDARNRELREARDSVAELKSAHAKLADDYDSLANLYGALDKQHKEVRSKLDATLQGLDELRDENQHLSAHAAALEDSLFQTQAAANSSSARTSTVLADCAEHVDALVSILDTDDELGELTTLEDLPRILLSLRVDAMTALDSARSASGSIARAAASVLELQVEPLQHALHALRADVADEVRQAEAEAEAAIKELAGMLATERATAAAAAASAAALADELADELADLERARAEASDALAAAQAELESSRQKTTEVDAALAETRTSNAVLAAEVKALSAERDRLDASVTEADAERRAAGARADVLQAKVDELRIELGTTQSELAAFKTRVDDGQLERSRLASVLEKANSELAALEQNFSREKVSIVQSTGEAVAELKAALAKAEARADAADAALAEARGLAADARQAAAASNDRIRELEGELRGVNATLESSERALANLERVLAETEERARAAESRADGAGGRADAAGSRLDAALADAAAARQTATAAEARAADAEARAADAEAESAEAEERAAKAETRAAEAETRADGAEARASEAEARASKAEARASEAEARATAAEEAGVVARNAASAAEEVAQSEAVVAAAAQSDAAAASTRAEAAVAEAEAARAAETQAITRAREAEVAAAEAKTKAAAARREAEEFKAAAEAAEVTAADAKAKAAAAAAGEASAIERVAQVERVADALEAKHSEYVRESNKTVQTLNDEIASLRSGLATARERELELTGELAKSRESAEAAARTARDELDALRRELASERSLLEMQVADAQAEARELREAARAASLSQVELSELVAQAEADREELEARFAKSQTRVQSLAATQTEAETLQVRLDATSGQLAESREALDAARREARRAAAAAEAALDEAAVAKRRAARSESELDDARKRETELKRHFDEKLASVQAKHEARLADATAAFEARLASSARLRSPSPIRHASPPSASAAFAALLDMVSMVVQELGIEDVSVLADLSRAGGVSPEMGIRLASLVSVARAHIRELYTRLRLDEAQLDASSTMAAVASEVSEHVDALARELCSWLGIRARHELSSELVAAVRRRLDELDAREVRHEREVDRIKTALASRTEQIVGKWKDRVRRLCAEVEMLNEENARLSATRR